jgi:hypothetical protein
LALGALLLGAAGDASAKAAPGKATFRGWFKKLRAMPQVRGLGSAYFDMHGNPSELLQNLIVARFSATASICKELDRVDSRKLPLHAEALYHVLATVQDPAAIPWLEKSLQRGKAEDLHRWWLPRWINDYLYGMDRGSLRWFTGKRKWGAFFQRQFKAERDPRRRLRWLLGLQQ